MCTENYISISTTNKVCASCKISKHSLDFNKDCTTKDGLQKKCRQCDKSWKKEYRKNNPKLFKEKGKKYREKYSQKISDWKKEWYKRNREKVIKKIREREKFYLKTDINYRIAHNLRWAVRNGIKNNIKYGKTIDLLGCSIQQLKQYIESKFTDSMSWENYGKYWHIDHIIPCSQFDLTKIESQKMCFHYTNLQPLSAKENYSKYNKIKEADIELLKKNNLLKAA